MQPVLLGIGAYLLVQFAIGVAVSRRIASESDYLLAGRRLGLGLAAFSIFATWFGAETVVGAAGSIYADGLSGGSADPFGYGLCLIVLGVAIAVPLWRKQYTTFGDLFRQRFSGGVERLAIVLMVPTSVLWAAAQIRAFGQVVSASSDLEVSMAITAAAVFVVLYTVAGGLLADVVTDLIQGIAVAIGLALLLIVVGAAQGGMAELSSLIEPERLRLFSMEGRSLFELIEAWAVPVFGSLLAVEMLSRILGCRTAAVARNATLLGAGMYICLGLIPVVLGLAGPKLVPNLEEPEQLIPILAQQHLSTFAYVLFAGALISAILSTVDSCLLAAASLVSHNLIVPLKPRLSERAKVWCARSGVIVFGMLAYVIALYAGGIYELVATASAFGSAGIFIVGIFGLFTTFGGARSAYAALVAGMAVWVVGEYLLEWSTPYIISLACALLAYVVAALLDRGYAAARADGAVASRPQL
ncbi:MAG TPA: sodium:solute symporter family protein [Gammaproteobacteria bacterium]|nr:sodium:solute symporter family protein [Gammaproteobacteria bacterium]